MDFEQLLPDDRGPRLRAAVLRALRKAYFENGSRFDPDLLGDNNTTFGVSIVHNLRHLIEVELESENLPGVIARRAKNSFWIEIDGQPLYIYKAAPGQQSVQGMRFDESELRVQIVEDNADLQLSLFDEPADGDSDVDGQQRPQLAPVITHFGNPEDGFTHAAIGAPFRTADGSCEWAWIEAFTDLNLTADAAPAAEADEAAEHDDDDFGLELRNDQAARDEDDEQRGESGA